MQIDKIVGNNIRKYRLAQKYSLGELAGLIHKSKSTLCKYEKGAISLDVDTIEELASIFGISPAELLAVPDEEETPIESGEFFCRRYMYTYDGQSRRVISSVIEQFHSSDSQCNSVQLYYDMDDLSDIGKCTAFYTGYSKKYEVWENYTLENQDHPIDKVWICTMDGLSQHKALTGIAAGLSSISMHPCARKIVITSDIMKEEDFSSILIFTKEDAKLFKSYNLFMINPFV